MIRNERHPEAGIIVPEIGTLFWHKLPSESGFGFRILFREDDAETGYGCIFRKVDPYTRQQDDQAGYLIDEERPFPEWLEQFVTDIQEWTRAELAILSYDRTTHYSNSKIDIDMYPDNEAFATFDHRTINADLMPTEYLGIPVRNYEIFIGSAAVHLASLFTKSLEE